MAAERRSLLRSTPTPCIEQGRVEDQAEADDRAVIEEIAQIDHTAQDALETTARPQCAQIFGPHVAEQRGHGIGPQEIEHSAENTRKDQSDNLARSKGRDTEGDGEVGAGQEQGGKVTAEDGTPVEIAQPIHRQGNGQREHQGDSHQR